MRLIDIVDITEKIFFTLTFMVLFILLIVMCYKMLIGSCF